MIDQSDKNHFFSIEKTQLYIDTQNPSLEVLMSNLPVAKENTILKRKITKRKEMNKGKSFDRSKV